MKKVDLLIALSLIASLFIYVFYRTERTVINEIVVQVISVDTFQWCRLIVTTLFPLNELMIYSLPEGLWVFCITITSKPFYLALYRWRLDGVIIPLAYSVGLEYFQLFRLTNGRFDFADVGVSLFFWAVAVILFGDHREKQNILGPLNKKGAACLTSYGIVYLSHVVS